MKNSNEVPKGELLKKYLRRHYPVQFMEDKSKGRSSFAFLLPPLKVQLLPNSKYLSHFKYSKYFPITCFLISFILAYIAKFVFYKNINYL